MTVPLDWKQLHQEALGHFRALLRLETVNPPGNEGPAARYLSQALEKEGIASQVLEKVPGRANLVARLSSGRTEGPLLLSAHLDVVPVEPDRWSHPPFGAEVADGFIWGRGTVDMKHMAVFNLMTLLLFKRLGIKPMRDLIFAAVADEEAGGDLGAHFLVERHPELIRAEYALNEVGGFTLHSGKRRFYPIQVAEKGVVWLKIRVRGEGGHGSLPHGENAVVKLAPLIQRLNRKFLPRHVHPIAARFIRSLSCGLRFPASWVLRRIMGPGGDLLLKILPDREAARFFVAILHNTACPTILEGGQKINVIPGEASLSIDGRILPGMTPEIFLEELKECLGNGYETEVLKQAVGRESPVETPLFRVLKEVVEERDPGSEAIPYLISGFTDALAYEKLGIKTYGFSPIKLPPGLVFSKLPHNHDERIPIDGFLWGLETFFEAVKRFVTRV